MAYLFHVRLHLNDIGDELLPSDRLASTGVLFERLETGIPANAPIVWAIV